MCKHISESIIPSCGVVKKYTLIALTYKFLILPKELYRIVTSQSHTNFLNYVKTISLLIRLGDIEIPEDIMTILA